ncbi:hypothetical protein V7S43_006012 [Phytophthora oleae]|uniref:Bacterial bifunctional deaminase-reductase C-terminal domain-containing protein n=1 Tax=Phytophthora oleae TaxID=2107226 RepID=A0ABD3FQV6_9STRA
MSATMQQGIRRQVCEAQENWTRKCDASQKAAMPFVTLTYAQSIDGSLTAERGKPTLLSGPASMKMTHILRTVHDGIMVGVGTIIADNPSLNARLAEGKNPRPIVIDTNLRCPTDIKLFTLPTCENPILLCARGLQDPGEDLLETVVQVKAFLTKYNVSDAEILRRKQVIEKLGARVIECETTQGEDGCAHVHLRDAFRVLKEIGINSVMVEGGSAILTSCLQEAAQRPLINLVVVTIAPTFIGGLRAVDGLLSPSTSAEPTARIFPRLTQPRYHVLEEDLVIIGHLEH